VTLDPLPQFLTVAEIAELLRLNPQTVRNFIDRGDLKALQVGARRVRVRRSDLDAFLQIDPEERVAALPTSEPPGEAPPTTDDLWDRVGAALVAGLDVDDRVALADRLRKLADELSSPRPPRA
jgi:excisionase family DNA binding protein